MAKYNDWSLEVGPIHIKRLRAWRKRHYCASDVDSLKVYKPEIHAGLAWMCLLEVVLLESELCLVLTNLSQA